MGNVVKSLLVLAGFVAAAMWVLDPPFSYEPLVVFLTAAALLCDHFFLKPKPSTLTIDGKPLAFDLSIGWNESPRAKS